MSKPPDQEKILFVTGRLAEASLRRIVSELAGQVGFQYEVAVPGVQVAALLHVNLLAKRLVVSEDVDRVILPGWCGGDPAQLEQQFDCPVQRGPRDLYDLPEFFGVGKRPVVSLETYQTEIVAEINHATQQPLERVLQEAVALAEQGADVIDVGCVPGESSPRVGEIVAALCEIDLRVSIDSFDRSEVERAVAAGAELVLSCNGSNIDWLPRLGVEVVAIPDRPDDLDSLDRTVECLDRSGVPFRLDPVIEPIGMGFTRSLRRYMTVRERYPDVAMMMGVGNITELTEVDSAGINMILAAICEELEIASVLTTQVINWCRSSVAELNAARRLVHYAVEHQVLPKHLDSALVMLRDPRLRTMTQESLAGLADALTDDNFRIFADEERLHLMNRHGHWTGTDAFRLFAEAQLRMSDAIEANHAFYLGYEMARAELSRHLGKRYVQDEAMNWGLLGDWKASSAVHHHAFDAESEDG